MLSFEDKKIFQKKILKYRKAQVNLMGESSLMDTCEEIQGRKYPQFSVF